jgi:hypothetical protein
MMLTREDLWTLEAYSRERPAFRARVMAHKRLRTVHVGEHLTLLFEDRLTIHYQVQEMLRIEKIFETSAIQDELAAYTPLIPDGDNWKATLLIEYADVAERGQMLARLKGIERALWVQVEGFPPLFAIADEDLERETEDKTSAVHFLRYTVPLVQQHALHRGASLLAGVTHPAYPHEAMPVAEPTRQSLVGDLLQ